MDYEGITSLLMFSSCETRKCINVTIVNDAIAEDTEFFTAHLGRTDGLDPRITLDPDNATVYINDNDGMLYTALVVFGCIRT